MHAHLIKGSPSAVKSLRLVPLEGDLQLKWERPDNVPNEVTVLYAIVINNTETLSSSVNYTTDNFFSLQFLENGLMNDTSPSGVCVMFEFSTSGKNDAGMGPPTTITDTIPICKCKAAVCS